MRRRSMLLACLSSAVAGAAVTVAAGHVAGVSIDLIDGPRPVAGTVVFGVRTGRPVVALTFDDGPDPRWTPVVLDLLARYQAKCTFFLEGRNAERNHDLVGAELAGGHEIGNHTYSHPDLQRLSVAAVQNEIQRGAEAIHAAGAPSPRLFRPPLGLSDEAVGVLAEANHYRTVLWNLAVEHYVDHDASVALGVDRLLARVHPGTIILAHDGGIPDRSRTMRALPLLLEGLRSRGYQMVTVTDLLRAADPALPTLVEQ